MRKLFNKMFHNEVNFIPKNLPNIIQSPSYRIDDKLQATSLIAPMNKIPLISPIEPFLAQELDNRDVDIIVRGTYINKFDDIHKTNSPRLLEKTKIWLDITSHELYWSMYNTGVVEQNLNICIISGGLLLRRSIGGTVPMDRVNVILTHFTAIFRANDTPHGTKSDIADVFMHNLCPHTHPEIVEEARLWIERHRVNPIGEVNVNGVKNVFAKNVYSFSQNVHSAGISKSVSETLGIFSKEKIKESPYKTIEELKKVFSDNRTVIKTLDRIVIDTAVFSYGFRLRDVIQHVWFRIKVHMRLNINTNEDTNEDMKEQEMFIEMKKRLEEELQESLNYCSTGYLCRIVNTLAGFDEDVSTGVGYADEIYASVVKRIQSETEKLENSDEIIDGLSMISPETIEIAKQFIEKIKAKISDEIFDEYKSTSLKREDFNKHFKDGLKKFFNT